jgi:hypothetical protein
VSLSGTWGKPVRQVFETRTARPPYPAWAGPAERLRYLLGYAIQAPSRRNSQPWLFEIEGDELRLRVDRRRALKAVDPQGRESVMACGAALENICLAAAHHGYDAEVDLLAGRRAGDLLARLRLGDRRAPAADEEQLFHAIPVRRTARTFRSTEVAEETVQALAGAADAGGCRLRQVRPSHARPVAELVAEADATQWANARFRAELALWRGGSAVSHGQDTPPAGPPAAGLRLLLSRFCGAGRELDRRVAEQTRALLVLSTRGDEPRDWLDAGRAMQRSLLRAAAEGLLASYLSQAVEVPATRARLRRVLFEPGYPQLLVRVGSGPALRPAPRRPVGLVLQSFSSEVEVAVEEPAPRVEPAA